MSAPVHSKTFKSGNSVALRLPKGLGFAADETMIVVRSGDTLMARRIPTSQEEAERLARFRVMMDELHRLGPVGDVQQREPFEFPDRPGLY